MSLGGDEMTSNGMVFTTWQRTGIALLLAGITWNASAHANTDIDSLIAATRAQDTEAVQALLADGTPPSSKPMAPPPYTGPRIVTTSTSQTC